MLEAGFGVRAGDEILEGTLCCVNYLKWSILSALQSFQTGVIRSSQKGKEVISKERSDLKKSLTSSMPQTICFTCSPLT